MMDRAHNIKKKSISIFYMYYIWHNKKKSPKYSTCHMPYIDFPARDAMYSERKNEDEKKTEKQTRKM